MSDSDNFGFGKFVPGFDFLQNLAKGGTQSVPQMPSLANWVAPTLNVEDLQKRIDELKAVHFWLDQNSRALGATVQALEVQKMTLATLKGMNFNMGDIANALKLKTPDSVANSVFSGMQKATETATDTARAFTQALTGGKAKDSPTEVKESAAKSESGAGNAMVDPMHWWGALTQQFQQIATSALSEAARQTGIDSGKNLAAGLAKETIKSASAMAMAATDAVAQARPTARKRATVAEDVAVKKAPSSKSTG